MKKKTLTIGIPAFNEEANIAQILSDVLKQKTSQFIIEKIIVSSDNSTDKTDEIVRKIKNKKIVLLSNKKREGQAKRQNQIIKHTSSDVLVLLNADIRIIDKRFLEKLITPILHHVDLTSSYPIAIPATGFIEKILEKSTQIKTQIFESYKNGDNIYTCHGRARAFSKRLYKKISFEKSVGEDAYSYLACKKLDYKYKNVKSAKVLYKLPENLQDHKKQSIRFIQTKKLLSKKFGTEMVNREFYLPKYLVISTFSKALIQNPLAIFAYIAIFIYSTIKSKSENMSKNTWGTSTSSKKITVKGGMV